MYVRTSVAGDIGSSSFRWTDPDPYFDRVYGSPNSCSEQLCDPSQGNPVVLANGESVSGIDMQVEPGPVIRGRIVDAISGLTVAQGRVSVFDESDQLVGRYKISGVTGQYQTTALEPGTYTLVAEVSPAFEVVTDSSSSRDTAFSFAWSRATDSLSGQDGLSVTVGTEDVDADLRVVEIFSNRIFSSRFMQQQ